MAERKKIAKIKVIDPGSMPDVDTDFHTEGREEVLGYVTEKYGSDAVSNIITFGTFGAKTAFKQMCTIYEKNFQQSNKITGLIPEPVEGVAMTLEDIFNPEHDRYNEAADFRNAVDDKETWGEILEGAMAIESKVKSTGVHACGILMSSQPFDGVLPTQVRQKDNRVISQWEYEDCEAIGLIKMDFLGLDTIDLIEKTLEYIERSGKKVPDLEAIEQGDMQDKKTFEMIRQGSTIGVFQIGKNPGVRDLLRRMQPTSVEDIIATTAMYRPGPMAMNSHTKYADRKMGREEAEPIHPDFKGTVLDEILENTHNLIVFQEQILLIANQIGGLTLQEGDKLRKAMGKKKLDVMEKMKPKFMDGGKERGFSEEALNTIWETMVPFAKYAFNRAHSASYAINAYKTAYLKANYPTEFMAAAIAQKIEDSSKKDETLVLIKEARRMGLKLGPVDINSSDVEVAPALEGSEYDIVFGFAGVKSVSHDNAIKIVEERKENGEYKSIQDFVKRNIKKGVDTRTLYENLALAGTFDSFDISRKSIVDNVSNLLTSEKKTRKKGTTLFASAGIDTDNASTINFSKEDEYSFTDLLKKEADMCGMYLSAHPLERAGSGIEASGRTKIKDLLNENNPANISGYKKKQIRLIGSITDMSVKTSRSGNKAYLFTVDDGTGYIEVRAVGNIASAFIKHSIIQQAENKRAKEGLLNTPLEQFINPDFLKLYKDDLISPIPEPEKNDVYILECAAIKRGENLTVALEDVKPFKLDYNGHLPVRLRIKNSWLKDKESGIRFKKKLKTIADNHPGETSLWIAQLSDDYSLEDLTSGEELDLEYKDTNLKVNPRKEFLKEMEDTFTADMFDLGIVPLSADIE